MLFIYRWIKGFLKVGFYGDSCERILNISARNRITFWNTKLVKRNIETCIYIKDIYKLRIAMRKSHIRLKILERHGLPFIVNRYKKRFGIAAGMAIFFCFLWFMSGYIWIIDVSGNKYVKKEEIIKNCNSIGIYEGVKKTDVNAKYLREKLLINTEDIAWASLNVEGSRLTVNVSETKKKNEQNQPTNLKACYDGIITKIDIISGNCLVRKGDAVKKGDILVSGIIENGDGTRFVASNGKVFAEIECNYSLREDYSFTVENKTNNKKHKVVFELFTLKIPLFLGSETGKSVSALKVIRASLFGQNLPIRIYDKTFTKTIEQNVFQSEEKAKEKLEIRLKETIKKEGIDNYFIKSAEFCTDDNGVVLNAVISAEINIAVAEKMLVAPENSD